MSSKDATADSLPAIPKKKHSLVEAPKKSIRSAPSFEDSGLDLRDSASSLCSRRDTASSRSVGARSPPNLLLKAATAPLSPRPQSPLTRSLEYVRISRSELDHKEHAVSSLRSENVQLQVKLRELENCRDSYAVLQSACLGLGQTLGCTMEGVAPESVGQILGSRASRLTQEHKQTLHQLGSCRSELDGTKGELAAANVRVSGLESQLEQARGALAAKEAQMQQLRSELSSLQQSSARTNSMVESLREQLVEADERKCSSHSSLTELHTEIGRLKNELKEKDKLLGNSEVQLAAKQAEQESLQERAADSDAVYADLCSQLASALQADSFDTDYLISQVSLLVQECDELRLRVETMSKTMKTAELDSKASRETILRLVSEVKKHEKGVTQISEMQQAHGELRASMVAVERERDSLQERLMAAKETLSAQEEEMQSKDARIMELSSAVQSVRAASHSEKAVLESEQLKFEEFSRDIATLTGSLTTDSVVLLQTVEQLVQGVAQQEKEHGEQIACLRQLESECSRLQEQLQESEGAREEEGSKVKQLEGELVAVDMVKEGMQRELEKYKSFHRKLAKAVGLDSATVEILSGEFAEEAILTKAEQLAKQETQTLTERQTAVYSLQRKLKACRQQLEGKELHLGLLQKKVASLEERLLTFSHRETDWEAAVNKARKLEKQMERLQNRAAQHKDAITRLKAENLEFQKLKNHCAEQEERIAHLETSMEELGQAKAQLARQLAEVRQRVQGAAAQERSGLERAERELRGTQAELQQARDRERQLSVFRTAVQRLLTREEGSSEEAPSDYDLIATLEGLIASHRRHSETAKCLVASLKQLEIGFKSGYNDAITLLNSSA